MKNGITKNHKMDDSSQEGENIIVQQVDGLILKDDNYTIHIINRSNFRLE